MPGAPHGFGLGFTDHTAREFLREVGNIRIVLPPDIVENLEAQDRVQAPFKMGRMRVGAHPGGIDKANHPAGRGAEAGEDIHILAGSLAVEGVKLAEDLQARLRGIVEAASDPVEIDLDVAVTAIAGVFDDVEEKLFRLRMVGHDPVRSVWMERIGIHKAGNPLGVLLDRIGICFHPGVLGIDHERSEPNARSPALGTDIRRNLGHAGRELLVALPVAIHDLVAVVDLQDALAENIRVV